MAKLTLTDLDNLQNDTSATNAINTNNTSIETAMENTLSRDGTTPNTMSANLDMNSNRIVNLAQPANSSDAARLVDVTALYSLDTLLTPGTTVDSEIVLFNGTGGDNLKSATQTGILKGTSGVLGTTVGLFEDSSGRVGIGTSTPAFNLQVKNASSASIGDFQGVSDGINYAVLRLVSDEAVDKIWQLGHIVSGNSLFLSHYNGSSWLDAVKLYPTGFIDLLGVRSTLDGAGYSLNGSAGTFRYFDLLTNLSSRFHVGLTNTAESGSNVGSDFFINAFSDVGGFLGQPFFIQRSSCYVGICDSSPSATLSVGGTVKVGTYTVGTLPAAGTVGAGTIAYVTDANATTQNSIVAAGGSNTVLVFSDGTNWRIS